MGCLGNETAETDENKNPQKDAEDKDSEENEEEEEEKSKENAEKSSKTDSKKKDKEKKEKDKEKKEKDKDKEKKDKEKKEKKEDKNANKKVLNLNSNKDGKKKNGDKNNVETESKTTDNIQKITKSDYNGVTVLENIKECFPEDVSEEAVHNIVIDALGDNIASDDKKKKKKKDKTITQEQADAIAEIVYKKVQKGSTGKKNTYEKVSVKEYPILKDVNLRIGLTELTKDVIKDVIYDGKKVDDEEVEATLQNFIKNNGGCKALMIEFDN